MGSVSGILFILANVLNIYEISMYYWVATLVLSSLLLIGLVYSQLKKVNTEGLSYGIDY